MKIKLASRSSLRRKLAAFSLLEATVGMGVIGAVVGAMLTGITTGTFTMRMARENLRATQIMLEKVETIRLYNWDQVTTNFIPASFTNTYDPQSVAGSQGLQYIGTLTISPVDPNLFSSSYSNQMRLVTVHLAWQTGGLQRSRDFTSYIAQNGLQDYIY
jgi:type II secretory pathway pseudopilin PulG